MPQAVFTIEQLEKSFALNGLFERKGWNVAKSEFSGLGETRSDACGCVPRLFWCSMENLGPARHRETEIRVKSQFRTPCIISLPVHIS